MTGEPRPAPGGQPRGSVSRRALLVATGAGALLLLGDVLRWMAVGPLPPAVLGTVLPGGAALEAEAALGAVLAVCALALAGGLRRRWGTAAAVTGLSLAALLANLGPFPTFDTAPATVLPFALLRDGQLTFEGTGLDSPLLRLSADPLPYCLVRSGDRVASKYSPAPGLLAAPLYLPAALGRFDARREEVVQLGKLAAALLTALGVACVHAASVRLTDARVAAAATALYVLGTPVLPVLGQTLWLHTGAAFGFSVALLALTRNDRPVWWTGALVGVALGVAVACRPVDLVLAAGIAAALWQVRPRALGWMVGTAAVPLLLLAVYQAQVFGSPLATGYGAEASYGWQVPLSGWALGVLGLLVSPGRGLLLHAPVLLLALLALARPGRARSPQWFLPLALALLAFLGVMGHWYMWWGGSSPGNRMLSDGLPILGVALACGLDEAWRRARLRVPIVALAVVSGVTSAALTFDVHAPLWVQVMSVGGEEHPRPWDPGTHPVVARVRILLTGATR